VAILEILLADGFAFLVAAAEDAGMTDNVVGSRTRSSSNRTSS
jgi:hypothetical protein